MGGALIGLVDTIDPAADAAGQPIAVLNLSLDKKVEPLPVDSTFDVRLKGSIGLKYLDVTKGTLAARLAERRDGAAGPEHAPRSTSTSCCRCSTPPTRKGVTQATIGFSDALAARGADINNAIARVPPARQRSRAGGYAISRRRKTDFGGFFRGLERSRARSRPSRRRRRRCTRTSTRHSKRSRRSRSRFCSNGSPTRRRRSRR